MSLGYHAELLALIVLRLDNLEWQERQERQRVQYLLSESRCFICKILILNSSRRQSQRERVLVECEIIRE